MVDEGFKRKLTAILSADAVGYSRLMAEDEAATVKTMASYREIMSSLIKQHRGRVVDSPGDNLLAEFSSVVDAVQCAVAVQNEFQTRNAKLHENRRMEFRIGINLGDVIDEEDRLYGDGVNIAARLESMADPGGICVSKTAFDQIETKLPLGYEYLGEQSVKNIPKPVGAYRVLMKPDAAGKVIGEKRFLGRFSRKTALAAIIILVIVAIALVSWNIYLHQPQKVEPASTEKMAFPLPDMPSIAVLPFVNLSIDLQQEYFSDGLTEEIITALSKVPKIFVIARDSVFTYKGKPVEVKQVAEELGIQYVLEGSIRKSGDQIRISAQLIDALSGRHLWAERYDRELKDIFAVQDELTKKIITAMQVELTAGEQALVDARGTNNLQAYLKFLQARENVNKLNLEGNALGKQMAQEAIDLDPQYAMAYRVLAAAHRMDVFLGTSKSPKQSIGTCMKLLNKAIKLDETYAEAYGAMGFTLSMIGKHDKAIATAEKAVALDPNSATTHSMLGHTLRMANRPEEAIRAYTKAIRLNPIPPTFYLFGLGLSYALTGQYVKGIIWCQKAVQQEPDSYMTRIMMTAVYSMAGRDEDARTEAKEVLRVNPKFSIAKAEKRANYKYKDKMMEALRKAGLPEHPPLPLPDKPSIAILAFDNLSGDPEQEYFVDGMTDDLITDLSKISGLFVIARHSAFQYKGKVLDVKKISRELGIRYVLKGSVRRADNKIRINAQLIDATTGGHLWAERYDREQKDLFKLQNEILNNIVTALDVKLVEGEQAKLYRSATENPKAYDAFAKGFDLFRQFRKDANLLAQHYLQKAIELDPEYAEAMGLLGTTHWANARYGWSASRSQSIEKGKKIAEKALRIDSKTYLAMSALSLIHLLERDYDRCMEIREQAFSINPNSADSNALMAFTLSLVGKEEEALPFMETAMRLSPFYPSWYLSTLCDILRLTGRHDEAIATAKAIIELNLPHGFEPGRLYLAAILIELGREEEARGLAEEYRKLRPTFSLKGFKKSRIYKDPKVTEKLISQLRKAGFPE